MNTLLNLKPKQLLFIIVAAIIGIFVLTSMENFGKMLMLEKWLLFRIHLMEIFMFIKNRLGMAGLWKSDSLSEIQSILVQ
jgi:hypothetical protein